MSMSISISSVKTFYVCNNCSRANAIAFIVVLVIEFISFYLLQLLIYACLFVCLLGWIYSSSQGFIWRAYSRYTGSG
jgi:hypothetical protein